MFLHTSHLMKLTVVMFPAIIVAFSPFVSSAEPLIFNYSCSSCVFPHNTHGDGGCDSDKASYPLRVDTDKNILEWRGKKYSLSVQEDCGQHGWLAKGNGTSFKFCTGTKGYGAIQNKEDQVVVQCSLKR